MWDNTLPNHCWLLKFTAFVSFTPGHIFNCVTGGTIKYALIYTSSAIVNTQHVPVHHQRWSQCVWNKPHLKHTTQMLDGQKQQKCLKVITHACCRKKSVKNTGCPIKNDPVNIWQYNTGGRFSWDTLYIANITVLS